MARPRVYVASSLTNARQVQEAQAALIELGWRITYDWTEHGDERHAGPERLGAVARAEIGGVRTAHAALVILPEGYDGTGGRGTHTELGAALALGVKVFLVWPESATCGECAFYHTADPRDPDKPPLHPSDLEQFGSWQAAVRAMARWWADREEALMAGRITHVSVGLYGRSRYWSLQISEPDSAWLDQRVWEDDERVLGTRTVLVANQGQIAELTDEEWRSGSRLLLGHGTPPDELRQEIARLVGLAHSPVGGLLWRRVDYGDACPHYELAGDADRGGVVVMHDEPDQWRDTGWVRSMFCLHVPGISKLHPYEALCEAVRVARERRGEWA